MPVPEEPLEQMPSFERERPPQSPYDSRPASPDSSSLDTFGSLASASVTTDSSGSSGTTADELEHWALKVFKPPSVSTSLTRYGRP